MSVSYVLGLNGYHEPVRDYLGEWNTKWYHDASAVLVRNGEVAFAVEEERLTRNKHTGTFPCRAIASCLHRAGLTLDEVDAIAVGELGGDGPFRDPDLSRAKVARALAASGLTRSDLSDDIHLVEHHEAHAMSAYYPSGFEDALVVTLDGFGDGIAGLVMEAREGRFSTLRRLQVEQSLGNFFAAGLPYFGYGSYDEYKLMGLASFGDPERYASVIAQLYELRADGDFGFPVRSTEGLMRVLGPVGPPRAPGGPFQSHHKDLAAALQHAFATIVEHLLQHFAAQTGLPHLCMAGGCAQNSAFNGRLAAGGRFERIFVQPASNDAGTALGAALAVANREVRRTPVGPASTVMWGPPVEMSDTLGQTLDAWADFVDHRWVDDRESTAADLLEAGHVVGWVQGQSEFGPRALGARSILADPRRSQSKTRINEVIKEREAYRPFAPAVIEEAAHEYFQLSGAEASSAFMTFAVPVHPHQREAVPAITHVDGTARVQTVSRHTAPRFWGLLSRFGERTGIPMLLNTSFNSSREPIVQSAHDAITCLLTSKLEHLMVDNAHVRKKPFDMALLLTLRARIVPHVFLSVRGTRDGGTSYQLITKGNTRFPVSQQLAGWLTSSETTPAADEREGLARELYAAWVERLVELTPREA